jgi:anthranilate phosphoribosyltransferase
MEDGILENYFEAFHRRYDVDPADAEALLGALISSDDVALLAGLLSEWNAKGTTEDELFTFASIMRGRMKRITSRHKTFVDAVGTGGSKFKTFNVSTASAFVIAGAGVPVAKHGNRSATSRSGSADVLTDLGIEIDLETDETERHLNEYGICFMFAPRFHSLSPSLAAARRTLHMPTIFNNLGPLCNPADAPHHVIGVWHEDMLEKTANVLSRLQAKRSWVVHGENGLDEIALNGKTQVIEIGDERLKRFEITAEDFGVTSFGNALPSKCTAEESAAIITEILHNERKGDSAETIVLMNAAAAIFISGATGALPDAYKMAEESVRNGAAAEKLTILSAVSKR